ncbi:helix-turn-helix domain-containing protein [Streptomyces chiangmaiensis]
MAEVRGQQLAEARKQHGLAQKDIAASMGVSIARVSQIEHGEVASLDVIARYVEALGAVWTSLRTSVITRYGCRPVTAVPVPPHDGGLMARTPAGVAAPADGRTALVWKVNGLCPVHRGAPRGTVGVHASARHACTMGSKADGPVMQPEPSLRHRERIDSGQLAPRTQPLTIR